MFPKMSFNFGRISVTYFVFKMLIIRCNLKNMEGWEDRSRHYLQDKIVYTSFVDTFAGVSGADSRNRVKSGCIFTHPRTYPHDSIPESGKSAAGRGNSSKFIVINILSLLKVRGRGIKQFLKSNYLKNNFFFFLSFY